MPLLQSGYCQTHRRAHIPGNRLCAVMLSPRSKISCDRQLCLRNNISALLHENLSILRLSYVLRHDSFVSLPYLLLHSLTPLSTSALVTPSLTKHITTPRLSTFRFRTSSSKKSISSYGTPLALCILEKCCFLSPGKIWIWSKYSIARLLLGCT